MGNLFRSRLARVAVGVGIFILAICIAALGLMLGREERALVEDIISTPQRQNVVLELTIKDDLGNPLTANVELYTFLPVGREGGYQKIRQEVQGSARMEFNRVRSVEMEISGGRNYESYHRDWDFIDLEPGEWRRGNNNSTIVIWDDVVLSPFPWKERPELKLMTSQIDSYGVIQALTIDGSQKLKRTVFDGSVPLDGCSIPTLSSAYLEAPHQVSALNPENAAYFVYPNGKQIALRVCSSEENDGLLFSGVFPSDGLFGNTTSEAPADGYARELVLPYEWFLERKAAIVYVRLGGLYGKLLVYCTGIFPVDEVISSEERPRIVARVLYNPIGSRNLRTTYPD